MICEASLAILVSFQKPNARKSKVGKNRVMPEKEGF